MPSSHESAIGLIDELIKQVIPVKQHSIGLREKHEEKKKYKLLQNRILEIILSFRKETSSSLSNDETKLSELEELIWYSHSLNQRRQFDEASKLLNNFKFLKAQGHLEKGSDVRCILRLLLSLSDSTLDENGNIYSKMTPRILMNLKEKEYLPSGPLNFNDTKLYSRTYRKEYTHYPANLFNPLYSDIDASPIPLFNNCRMEPGKGLTDKFFSTKKGDCLGALVDSRDRELRPDAIFQIPELPARADGYSFASHFLAKQVNQNSLNHPRINSSLNISVGSKVAASESAGYEDDSCIWEEQLNAPDLSKRRTWEDVGRPPECPEKPFLSEAPPDATERIYLVCNELWSSLLKNPGDLNLVRKDPKLLCLDILHLLTGIPSTSFSWSEEEGTFKIQGGLCTNGVTPESLLPHLADFVSCGNQVKRLEDLCNFQHTHLAPIGTVFDAFLVALKNFISVYRRKVLSLAGGRKFFELKFKTEDMRQKIFFVSNICGKGGFYPPVSSPLQTISWRESKVGLRLLGELLFTFTQHNTVPEMYTLLSLLSNALKPFFEFISRWIYAGECNDPYSEYFISSDPIYLLSYDQTYWTMGHKVNSDVITSVPNFMQNVLHQCFLCGKSLNLLRSICPKNFLLKESENSHPALVPCFSTTDLRHTKEKCSSYLNRVTKLSSIQIKLKDLDNMANERKDKLVQIAAEKHINVLQKIEEQRTNAFTLERREKRAYLDSQKMDIERMKKNRQQEKELDDEEERKAKDQLEQQTKIEIDRHKMLKDTLEIVYETKILKSEIDKRNIVSKITSDSPSINTEKTIDFANKDSVNSAATELSSSSSRMSITSDILITPNEESIPDIEFDVDNVCSQNLDPQDISNLSNENVAFSEAKANKERIMGTSGFNEERTTTSKTLRTVEAENIKKKILEEEFGIKSDITNQNIMINTDDESFIDAFNANMTSNICSENQNSVENNNNNNGNQNLVDLIVSSKHDRIDTQSLAKEDHHNYQPSSIAQKDNNTTKIQNKDIENKAAIERFDDTQSTNNLYENNNESESIIKETEVKEDPNQIPHKSSPFEAEIKDPEKQSSFGVRMRKSKSETFADTDARELKLENRRRAFHSCLFDSGDDEEPLLIDKVSSQGIEEKIVSSFDAAGDSIKSGIFEAAAVSSLPYNMDHLKDCGEEPTTTTTITSSFCKSTDGRSKAPQPEQLLFVPNYIMKSLSLHLQVQSRLVNEALLSHFLVKERLLDHLSAIRAFLFLHDAPFAHALTQNVLGKWEQNTQPGKLLNHIELNGILHECLGASSHQRNSLTDNLSFVVSNIPSNLNRLSDPFDYIELHYSVKWPLNVILDRHAIEDYYKVGRFVARLRHVLWAMDDTFKRLKSIAFCLSRERSPQLHQVSIFRHGLHQFARTIFGYVCHHGMESCWAEFESNVRKVSTLDELRHAHWAYVRNILARLFLSPNSAVVLKALQELFGKILTFRRIVLSHSWGRNPSTGGFEHRGFAQLKTLWGEFQHDAKHFFKLLQRILKYSQLDHIDYLVSALNFNDQFEQTDHIT